MKYVHLENNKILGYYDKEINSTIPKGCLEITDKQWQEALNINANCYENGKFIYKDFRTPEEIKKAELQAKINEANQYLKDTDWVKDYKTRHDLGLELIPEDSSKWLVINKRTEYIAFLKDSQ